MPTFSPHFKVGISETVSERTDLRSALQSLRARLGTFQTTHTTPNANLTAIRTEINGIIATINGFDPSTYTLSAVTDVITKVKALRKTLKTAHDTVIAESIRPNFTTEILKSPELRLAIDAADEFNSKAIGGIMNHAKNRAMNVLTWDNAKEGGKKLAIGLGITAGLVGGGFAAKKGYEAAFDAPGAHPTPRLVANEKFDLKNVLVKFLTHNGGEKNIDATSFDNFWGALRDGTTGRVQQAGHMSAGITLEGKGGDTLVIYADKEGSRKVITFSARDAETGQENVDMWTRDGGQIMYKTGHAGAQYAPTTSQEMREVLDNIVTFIGQ